MGEPLILTLSCADQPGITALVTGFLYERGCNILDAQQFNDRPPSGAGDRFFMRIAFDPDGVAADRLKTEFSDFADAHAMEWKLARRDRPRRVIIMVSKFDHCLVDLLYRWRTGELPIDPVAIISNHPREVAIRSDIGEIPFHYLPVTPETKEEQEEALRALAEELQADLVVLARYMQIFSDAQARHFAGRCINIHHSFLPGFKGARPYTQAYERGVKIIGATAHFVTGDLDEGPIIHQDVERITHADSASDLVRKGRDIERRVLAEAVRLFVEERVLLNGNRTVVFRG
ncbi:formyltetrahydrofolate deformylase [Erythrobacter sp. HL-111]|uniref:formyltetrahydrofolate deformylase n=1 Tax=Erythrobacter sp. HL-111 TaxID=1798193 RepID=UPI0006DB1FFB|nr:formyltetrahydrofolate deformylase [Erythrobacter sp. HL-111]KPP94440.1 MAG: formyltetrahydrofolate deformylase PurU [Erythrobacteraceae bacterium HL-111]SDS57027.1 formyltetrahydrofolate deformylase [Erythrobacter sp. HL-111]